MNQKTFWDDEHDRDQRIKREASAPYAKGSDTSQEAAESIKLIAGSMRHLVYQFIASRECGATCDETEIALDMSHQTCSARIRELRQGGHIIDTGLRRQTRTGRSASVYKVK